MQIPGFLFRSELPGLYEVGTAGMWDDEHISRYLLEMHLNPESDTASRKRSTILKTVGWIESFWIEAPRISWILAVVQDIYCELLAGHGHLVTGVDFSRCSLEYARQEAAVKHLEIEYLCQNYLELDLENRYDLVMMVFCDFDVVVPKDRTRLLQLIYRAL